MQRVPQQIHRQRGRRTAAIRPRRGCHGLHLARGEQDMRRPIGCNVAARYTQLSAESSSVRPSTVTGRRESDTASTAEPSAASPTPIHPASARSGRVSNRSPAKSVSLATISTGCCTDRAGPNRRHRWRTAIQHRATCHPATGFSGQPPAHHRSKPLGNCEPQRTDAVRRRPLGRRYREIPGTERFGAQRRIVTLSRLLGEIDMDAQFARCDPTDRRANQRHQICRVAASLAARRVVADRSERSARCREQRHAAPAIAPSTSSAGRMIGFGTHQPASISRTAQIVEL